MSISELRICPVCNWMGRKNFSAHLKTAKKLIGEEGKQMLKDAKYPSEMKERKQISNELNRFNVNDDSNNTTLEVDQSTNKH